MKWLPIGVFLCVFVVTINASKDIGEMMDTMFQNYDKRVRPNNRRLLVAVEVNLLDVYNFDELNHQLTLAMILRQKWEDPRLKFRSDELNGTKAFIVGVEQSKKMWFPDTFLVNERKVVKHEQITPLEYTRVHSDGKITHTAKLTVTIGCMLKLRWFPFDQNTCTLAFESYGYTVNDLQYAWSEDKKKVLRISDQAIQGIRFEITSYRQHDKLVELQSGTYSRAVLGLTLKRLSFRYLLDVYFPTIAITIIACISLIVGPFHFRVLMSTICMAMMIIYAAILMMLTPKVNYTTALDFYVFISSATVISVVVSNFLIYYLRKPKPVQRQTRKLQRSGSTDSSADTKKILVDEDSRTDAGQGPSSLGQPTSTNQRWNVIYMLCGKSYLIMPLYFLAFNVIYWTVVLIGSSGTLDDFISVEARE